MMLPFIGLMGLMYRRVQPPKFEWFEESRSNLKSTNHSSTYKGLYSDLSGHNSWINGGKWRMKRWIFPAEIYPGKWG
jgi:hypothetical protein